MLGLLTLTVVLDRTWHNANEQPATRQDFADYWFSKTVPAAETEQELDIAESFRDFDAVVRTSGDLLKILGVKPEVLVEILRCADVPKDFHHS
jgi:hypothetical protein